MLRAAHDIDITWLSTALLQTKLETGWRDEQRDGYTLPALRLFLSERLHDPLSVCYVWQADEGVPTAFCGCYLTRMFHPPYVPIVLEWGWWGPKRQAVSCWRACTQWGKKHGAVYGVRSVVTKVVHPRRIEDHTTWEKL